MTIVNINQRNVPQGASEYGPVTLAAKWTTTKVTLDVAEITQQTWFEVQCSFDSGTTWQTCMKLDCFGPGVDKQGNIVNDTVFSVSYPGNGIDARRVKLIVTSPVAWHTAGGTIEVT